MKKLASPNIKRTTRSSFLKLSCAALAVAAQVCFSSSSSAAPGDLYVTDLADGSIVVYAPDQTSRTFATGLISPQGIVFDQNRSIYVADAGDGNTGSGVIYKYDLDGNRTTFYPQGGDPGLDNPIGLSYDGFYLTVSENGSNTVSRIDPSGTKTPLQNANVTAPLGVDVQNGFTYIANGSNVTKVVPGSPQIDIPIGSPTRDVRGITTLVGGQLVSTIFVTTTSGQIFRIAPDDSVTSFAPGSTLTDPNGLAFRPARFGGDTENVGSVYIAEVSVGDIQQITKTGVHSTFVTGGTPNFLDFETGAAATPTPTPTPAPTPTPPAKLQNISSRVDVLTGDRVAIGGFILTGGDATTATTIVIRALGQSLGSANPPVADPLQNPILELHKPDGTVVTNDNWKTNSATDQTLITSLGLDMYSGQTINNSDSIIVTTITPVDPTVPGSGQYTAVLRDSDGGTGTGLIEVYDLDDPNALSELGNISTRAFVGTGDNVLIGGVIVGPEAGTIDDSTLLIRAIGPELASQTPPVAGALEDPFLQLFDAQGNVLASNDNWQDADNADDIEGTGIAPTDPAESAILGAFPAGMYTAIVSGVNGTTGVGLVEVYNLPTGMVK